MQLPPPFILFSFHKKFKHKQNDFFVQLFTFFQTICLRTFLKDFVLNKKNYLDFWNVWVGLKGYPNWELALKVKSFFFLSKYSIMYYGNRKWKTKIQKNKKLHRLRFALPCLPLHCQFTFFLYIFSTLALGKNPSNPPKKIFSF